MVTFDGGWASMESNLIYLTSTNMIYLAEIFFFNSNLDQNFIYPT